MYNKKLKSSIEDGTFKNKYNIIQDKWLEICHYKTDKEGRDEFLYCDSEIYYGIDEIVENTEEIKECLNEWIEGINENDKEME